MAVAGRAVVHRLKTLVSHPWWAISEVAGRARLATVPHDGIQRGRVGPLAFEFDLSLDIMVRRMRAGAYETHITRLIRKLLRPGDVFVDVGANIGYLSCVAAGRVGTGGRVLSFEPAAPYYARLVQARRLNPDYPWDTYPVAVAQSSGTAELRLSSLNIGWNTLVPGQMPASAVDQAVAVSTVSLDRFLVDAGVEHVRILKIDTEGYEGPVILGAADYLREGRVNHILVEMLPSQYRALGLELEQVLDLLRECGYEAVDSRHPHRPLSVSHLGDGADLWFRRPNG